MVKKRSKCITYLKKSTYIDEFEIGTKIQRMTYPNTFEPIKSNKHHVQWIEFMFADMVNKHHLFSLRSFSYMFKDLFLQKRDTIFFLWNITYSKAIYFHLCMNFLKIVKAHIDRKISCCSKFMLILFLNNNLSELL